MAHSSRGIHLLELRFNDRNNCLTLTTDFRRLLICLDYRVSSHKDKNTPRYITMSIYVDLLYCIQIHFRTSWK
jgi:hypothetical protein